MKRLNIRDIAKLAGVSRQTVSRVLNNESSVKEETRIKVQKVVKEFDYVPNKSARSHFNQYSMSVGLAIPDITNPFFPRFIRGVQDQADIEGYNVFIYNIDPVYQKNIDKLKIAEELAVDGIITFIARTAPKDLFLYAKRFLPMVVVNREITSRYVASVFSDNYRGAVDAVNHIIERGNKNIAFLGPVNEIKSMRRFKGYKDSLSAANIGFKSTLVSYGFETEEGGYSAMKKLLANRSSLDAIFCYNDLMALGAMDAIKEAGLSVPSDIAVVGFDDIELARRCSPALTTVSIDTYELGQIAFTQFMRLRGDEVGILDPIQIPTQLIVREST